MTIACKYLEHGMMIEPNGSVKPCCRYTGDSEYVDNPIEFKELYSTPRDNMANGIWDNGCLRCKVEEDSSNTSMRTSSLLPYDKFNRSVKPNSPEIKGVLTYLEITTGRYCNLKCRICDPVLSTSWDEDLEASDHLVKWFYGNNEAWEQDKAIPKTIDTMLNLSKDDCKYLNEVKVTGGEPFLSEYLAEFLQRLVDWGFAKNITLDIFTNATFIPKNKYIKNFNKFNTVFLNMSLDGIGKRGEFMRKKSNWSKVEEAVAWYCKLHNENKNIYIGVSHTQSLYNVLYYREFIDWCTMYIDKSILNDKESFFLNTARLSEPSHLSVYCLNNKQKTRLLELIDEDFNSFNFADEGVSSKWQNQVWHSLTELKNSLQTLDLAHIMDSLITTSALANFNKHERVVDVVRQENWETVFPKLKEFLNE